jgi:drug/metabolite transporter (DMT)-like permease
MSTLVQPLTTRFSTRTVGVALAFGTACISGIAVYVNSKGVSHFDDATVYTTAKNAVAGTLLLLLALPLLLAPRASGSRVARPATRSHWLALVAVACIGGSVPFVLFFEGLSRASATQAAFIHKTLIVWVALLAVPLLRERLGPAHVLAIGLLMVGQGWLAGNLGTVTFGAGEAMVLAATLLWAIEVIVVKRLVAAIEPRTLAAGRMGLGTVVLVAWVAATGGAGNLFGLSAGQWAWALLTGLLLTGYVATWYAALARAQAVDVTAVLVFGAVVTAVLAGAADGVPVDAVGLAVITAGVALAGAASLWRTPPREART